MLNSLTRGVARCTLLAATAVLLGLLAGCVGTPAVGSGANADVEKSRVHPLRVEAPVLQISRSSGGMVERPRTAAASFPMVTVCADGRAVFIKPHEQYKPDQALIREATLDPATVENLVEQATMLFDMQDRYSAFMATHQSSTVFKVQTLEIGKSVAVEGFSPELPSELRDREMHSEIMDRLRILYRAVWDALPQDAPPARFIEVSVVVAPAYPGDTQGEWPVGLTGQLNGEDAARAQDLLSPGPRRPFLVDGRRHWVTVAPVLPVLNSLPSPCG